MKAEVKEFDVLVVGAGIAGFSAAIAAAQCGKKVALVERESEIGGHAVLSNVGTICGAYYPDFKDGFKPVDHPLLQEIIDQLDSQPIVHTNKYVVLPYDWKVLKRYMLSVLSSQNISVLLNNKLVELTSEGDTIKSIKLEQGKVITTLKAKQYIDCSGNGALSLLLNLEMIRSEKYQSASQVFRLKGVRSKSEFSLDIAIKRALRKEAGSLPIELQSLSINPGSLVDGRVDLKFSLPLLVDDKADEQQIKVMAKQGADQVHEYLLKHINSLSDSKVEVVFPKPGIRIQQRSKGVKVLKEEDMHNAILSNAPKVIATWPIEKWDEAGNVTMKNLEGSGYYEIPDDCLRSYKIQNLFFGGKNISASDTAIASARVLGTCIQTGYRAGQLASKS